MFSGSLVALITPFDQRQRIDFASLRRLVDFHLEAGTSALVVNGTTAETATLEEDEQLALAGAVVEQVAGRIPVIAGNGGNCTARVIRLTERLAATGVDGFLGVTPYYNKPGQEGLYQHYRAVAESSALPQILYNVPARTGCDLLPETVERLAPINNIVGIKDATGSLERLLALQAVCPEDFCLLSGDDATASAFMLSGGQGVISVSANLVPAQMSRLCQLATTGQAAQATALNRSLYALHKGLFTEANPIPVKWGAWRMGLISECVMRLPLLPLAQTVPLEASLRDLALID